HGRNQLSGMFCTLQTDIDDPSERLRAIAASDARAKEHSASLGSSMSVCSVQNIPDSWLRPCRSDSPCTDDGTTAISGLSGS
ncbi:wax ester/triacylglycerol synthase family O-acyltransferase, partial [Mycobacterium sp. ITM-2017-0098]